MKTLTALLGSFGLQILLAVNMSAADPFNIAPTNQAESATTYTNQANDLLQRASTPKDFQDAAWLLQAALKVDPANDDTRMTLGWVYLEKLHEPHKAYPYLNRVAKDRPDDVNARKLCGMACAETGRNRQAADEFTQASRLQPDDLWIRANLARSLARLGHFHQADEIYKQILRTDPSNAEARLGLAELQAWRGYNTAPLDSLQALIRENPTNAEALSLSGDIHRWNWDLSEAKQEYKQALAAAPNDYEAKTGLTAAEISGMSDITLKGSDFVDTTQFGRASLGADTRLHLADKLYLLGGVAGWRFTNPGIPTVERGDADAGLEIDANRWFQLTGEGTVYEYQHTDDAHFGGLATLKLSPTPRADIYFSGAYQQPFVSSIATVTNGMKQDVAGTGLDFRLPGRISVQNNLQVANLSDGNAWVEERPQLSLHIFDKPSTFLRAQYDYLNYNQSRTNYWTPRHRNSAGPVLDSSIRLCSFLRIDLDGSAPYVFDAHRMSYYTTDGPTFTFGRWVELNGSFIYASVPPDPTTVSTPPWSGIGCQGYLRIRF